MAEPGGELPLHDVSLRAPMLCQLVGPSRSGKTTFLIKLLASGLIQPEPEKVYWLSGSANQAIPKSAIKLSSAQQLSGKFPRGSLLVIDDLAQDLASDEHLARIFLHRSHHESFSVVFITQNLFLPGKYSRTIAINCHYLTLFKNPRDQNSIAVLNRQMYPHAKGFLNKAYAHASRIPHGHLFIDMSQNCDDKIRVRSDIFSPVTVVYTPPE